LEYDVFKSWHKVDALLRDLEYEGLIIEELRDIRGSLPVCSGDWDARVSPGMEIDVICWDGELSEDSSSCGSNDDDEDGGINDVHYRGKHWWFERRRIRVERNTFASKKNRGKEPTRRVLVLGLVTIILFVAAVIVICAI
ncbi:hypothetical protein EK21DRAFT_74570, partial [Setomelanomma holmii]